MGGVIRKMTKKSSSAKMNASDIVEKILSSHAHEAEKWDEL